MSRLGQFLFLLALPLLAHAQSPADDWRTIETQNFRVHYPASYEEWTLDVASELESTRERVASRVGYVPGVKIDVIVADPESDANGSAWPTLTWPRIILWTTPPEPESVIGYYTDWRELLSTHEQAHILHLVRPSRNPLRRALGRILPLGPVADVPRWVAEGYATVIEGELTGSGRPFGDMRAAVLRTWARDGRMPSYGQLASDSRSWMGMSMAYLAGSAYLEWLQDRAGSNSLQKLWSRMTARQRRSFDASFEGVFGDSPRDLYARFVAELTASALAWERDVTPALREGELWQDLAWSTADPDVSPDGTQIVAARRLREGPSRLVVYSTTAADEEEKEYRKRIGKILERDPEDQAPVRTAPLPRKPRHELVARDGARPQNPRFSPDGKRVLFHQFEPDDDGALHPDLFEWELASGKVSRLTELADLREADMSVDGSIVAIRHRFGKSNLVLLDRDRTVRDLTAPSIDLIPSHPVFSPDGGRIAFVEHRDGRWTLRVHDRAAGSTATIPAGDARVISAPEWSSDGKRIFASIGSSGTFEIASIDPGTGSIEILTRSFGAAFAPAPSATEIFYLALDPDGLDLRRLASFEKRAELSLDSENYRLLSPRAPVAVTTAEKRPLPASSPYGWGRQEIFPLAASTWTPSSRTFDLGVRVGDLIGRIDTIVLASLGGKGSLRGAAASTRIERFPILLGAHLYGAEQQGEDQPDAFLSNASTFADRDQIGLELRGWKSFLTRARSASVAAGILAVDDSIAGELEKDLVIDASARWSPLFGKLRLTSQLRGAALQGDSDVVRFDLSAAVSHGSLSIGIERVQVEASNESPGSLGGIDASILPRAGNIARIIDPALPFATRVSSEIVRDSVTLTVRGIDLFARRYDPGAGADAIETYGAEIRLSLGRMPLLRLPDVDLRLGGAEIRNATARNETTYWLATTYRP
jgi:Tol biopolymer transport system component